MVRPNRSLIWLEKMITAIPAVKPVTTGSGIYLIHVPNRASPAMTSIAPAISVARTRPSYPWVWMTSNTTTTNAPVGPPI